MSFGRALLLGFALASAVASQCAFDPVDAGGGPSLISAADLGGDAPIFRPPAVAVSVVAPAITVVQVAFIPAAMPAPRSAARTSAPLVFAPKTSPPQA